MTMITATAMSAILVWSTKATNPIKASMAILFIGALLMKLSSSTSGSSWVPVLMLMLFMGGIIMMFMMLASILPNEKSMKIKNPLLYLPLLIPVMLLTSAPMSNAMMSPLTKSFLSSGQNFYMMMSLILLFFIGSMSTLSTENTPMRTISCY